MSDWETYIIAQHGATTVVGDAQATSIDAALAD
jgi:hypothetical protein